VPSPGHGVGERYLFEMNVVFARYIEQLADTFDNPESGISP
jgi:hypothetical protein